MAINKLDLTHQEEELVIDINSSIELKAKHEKLTHLNRVCLMIMKYTMDKTIKQSVPEFEKAKTFPKSIAEKFVKFYKVEKCCYLLLLEKTTYDGISAI